MQAFVGLLTVVLTGRLLHDGGTAALRSTPLKGLDGASMDATAIRPPPPCENMTAVLFETANCTGEPLARVDEWAEEKRCLRCFDVCGKRADADGQPFEGRLASVRVVGGADGGGVVVFGACVGQWDYPDPRCKIAD